METIYRSGSFSYAYIDHMSRFPPEKRAVFPLLGWVDPDSDGNFINASAAAGLLAHLARHSTHIGWHLLSNLLQMPIC